ncbi:uncharacterized protein TNCV_2390991 [Trichonephila clavipes]|nr:uncharacterized protein TNCV_2390991 [Trichonephila clavipes]
MSIVLLKNGSWEPLHEWKHMWLQDVMGITGLAWCHGSILGAPTASHAITLAVGTVCRCKTKAELRRSTQGLHTRTRLSTLLRLNLDSSLKMTWFHSSAVQFHRARHHSKWRRRCVGVKSSARNGRRDPKCPTARRLRMV